MVTILIRFLKQSSTPFKSTWLLIYQFYFHEFLIKEYGHEFSFAGLVLQGSSKILRLWKIIKNQMSKWEFIINKLWYILHTMKVYATITSSSNMSYPVDTLTFLKGNLKITENLNIQPGNCTLRNLFYRFIHMLRYLYKNVYCHHAYNT